MARFVMNASILPNDGIFSLATISEDEAKRWVARKDWVSAFAALNFVPCHF